MALNDFRNVNIIIDNINNSMDIPFLEANTGEYNGRILTVQLTNNGVVEPQTATMQFGFIHTADKGVRGVYAVRQIDKSKGLYEVNYPVEMLKLEGIVVCALKIVDGQSISVKQFKVKVAKSLFSEEMEVAKNSISAFNKVLVDINDHEGRIVEMELNFKELSKMLTMNIPNMDVAVSSRFSAEAGVDLKNRIDEINRVCSSIDSGVSSAYDDWSTDLSEKVNRHLDNYQVKHLKGSIRNSSGSLKTVLNITGEGEIYNLFIKRKTNYRGYHGKHVYIKLSFVDVSGRSRFIKINTSQDDNDGFGECMYQLITYNDIIGMVDKKYLEQTTTTGDSRNLTIKAEELQLYASVTHFADKYYVTVLKNPLYFKNLKIELRHDNPDGDETVDYEMHYGVKV